MKRFVSTLFSQEFWGYWWENFTETIYFEVVTFTVFLIGGILSRDLFYAIFSIVFYMVVSVIWEAIKFTFKGNEQ